MKKYLSCCLLAVLTSFAFAHEGPGLGISSSHLDREEAAERNIDIPFGSLVRRVYPNSAAEKAGLRPFDYVYRINEDQVSSSRSLADLLENYRPGQLVQVFFLRNGRQKQVNLGLDDLSTLDRSHPPREKDPLLGIGSIHSQLPAGVKGVPVSIVQNSTAQAMGLQRGDVVIKIDDYPVMDWADLEAAINARKVGDPIRVTYLRGGQLTSVSRPIKSAAATHNDHSRAEGPQYVGTPTPGIMPEQVDLTPISKEEAETLRTLAPELSMPADRPMPLTDLRVFPNPSSGIFDIQFDLAREGQTSVRVFDTSGRIVYQNNLGNFEGVFNDRIDIANTAKGIYFVQLIQEDQMVSRKLVVQ